MTMIKAKIYKSSTKSIKLKENFKIENGLIKKEIQRVPLIVITVNVIIWIILSAFFSVPVT
jgi:hypothetical protein